MLIIMHQNMVEQFSVLSNIQKLHMVEAAVGLEPFRENVLSAKEKLTKILSQEESVTKLLGSAEQTLNYWREQYEKFQEKKQLVLKRRFLDRELVWAEVQRRENMVKSLEANHAKHQDSLSKIEKEKQGFNDQLSEQQNSVASLRAQEKAVFDERLVLERGIAEKTSLIAFIGELLKETMILEATVADKTQFKLLRSENLQALLESSRQQIAGLAEQAKRVESTLADFQQAQDKIKDAELDKRVHLALLEFKRATAVVNVKEIEASLAEAQANLKTAEANARAYGERVESQKSASEIQDEIHLTEGHLAALANVSEDIEKMYQSYSKLYLELKEKAQVVAENREKTLEELKARMGAWRNVMENLLDRVNIEYQRIMAQTLATGEVKLSNMQDIETAGIEIYVGFKGSKPVALDAFTQSGGERTTATMAFLLALQQHVRSPFRAVDEYDIHMDPKNREMIAKILVSMIKDAASQYIVITPSQITFAQQDANVITVQNLEGKSLVKEVVK